MNRFKTSINHLTGREQQALHHIKKELTTALRPLAIFYLSSDATTLLHRRQMPGNNHTVTFEFSCELLIILPESSDFLPTPERMEELTKMTEHWGKVELLLRTWSQLKNHLLKGEGYFPGFSKKAIALYKAPDAPKDLPPFQNTKSSAIADTTSSPEQEEDEPTTEPPQEEYSSFYGDDNVAYRFYPQVLSGIDNPDPIQAIHDFFDYTDLPYALEHLRLWIENIRSTPDTCILEIHDQLSFYEYINLLMEAAAILHETPEHMLPKDACLSDDKKENKLLREMQEPENLKAFWARFPRSLPLESYYNPYISIDEFFDTHTLKGWKEKLHMLLHLSLGSGDRRLDLREGLNIHFTWNYLQQLIEACYLIHIRSSRSENHRG